MPMPTNLWYNLSIEWPKRSIGRVLVSVSKGTALAFTGPDRDARIVAQMERTQLEEIAARVIILTGMQPDGMTKSGVQKYRYQRWFLVSEDWED